PNRSSGPGASSTSTSRSLQSVRLTHTIKLFLPAESGSFVPWPVDRLAPFPAKTLEGRGFSLLRKSPRRTGALQIKRNPALSRPRPQASFSAACQTYQAGKVGVGWSWLALVGINLKYTVYPVITTCTYPIYLV